MRFLADESCDFAVIRALRANGHDVIAVSEVTPRAEDFKASALIGDRLREKMYDSVFWNASRIVGKR